MAEIFEIRKAQRSKAKLRLGLAGPSGAGKTHSSLLVAKGLGKRIAMIDTENKSGDLEAGKPGIPEYDVITLGAPFTCEKYIGAIKHLQENGYEVIIIDSLTHAWSGEGGILDLQGKITDSGKGNSYTAWRFVTPKHNTLVETILQSNCHIIATMRSKTQYVQQAGSNGKTEIKKVGMEPIQRDGMEYEFTIFLDINHDHTASSSKDRTSLFDGQYFKPSEEIGRKLLDWLEAGVDVKATHPVISASQETDKVVNIHDVAHPSEVSGKETEKTADVTTTEPVTTEPELFDEQKTITQIIEAMKGAADEAGLKEICVTWRPQYDSLSKTGQDKIIKEKKVINAQIRKQQQAAA